MTTTTSLRDEILGEMILNDNNGVIHSVLYGILTEKILNLFEKRIDELLPDSDYQLITKERIKEMLR